MSRPTAVAHVGEGHQGDAKLVRFDFPAGMSAADIAAALREAYDRIMAAKAADDAARRGPESG